MARRQSKTAAIQSMERNPATLRYEISFAAYDGRHDFSFRRRQGSSFRKRNQVGDVGVLVHAGKRFIEWTTTGQGSIIRLGRPRRPGGFRGRRIFLSYSTRHRTDGQWIYQVLQEVGHDVWYDAYSVAPSEALRPEIELNIQKSNVFVPVLDNDYVRSGWCRQELETAVAHGIRVAPVTGEVKSLSFPPAAGDVFHRVLGTPRMLDLRKGDVVNDLYRFSYQLGRDLR